MAQQRRIFRQQALDHYIQGREKTILPRLVAPPVFLCLWALLGLLIAATILAWQVQVPRYTGAAGVLVQDGKITPQNSGEVLAMLFVPASFSSEVNVGEPVTLQLTATGEQVQATVRSIEPGIISPADAQQRYGLTGDLAYTITQPSVIVTATLTQLVPPDISAGRSISAQVQVGSRSVLSLLPDLLHGILGG